MEENTQKSSNPEETKPLGDDHKENAKGGFWDFNASWITMLLYVVYLGALIFLARSFYTKNNVTGGTYYGYLLVPFFAGLVTSALLYNLGKVLFASLAGYRVSYWKILGAKFDHSTKKRKVSYHIADFDVVELKFVPKGDDLSKNPTPIFLGGLVFELLFVAACLVPFFLLKDSEASLAYSFLYAMAYGLVLVLYEFMPFRQDSPTDLFNLLETHGEENRRAYNLFYVNRRRELSGEDFLVERFGSYDAYYKMHDLYFVYLDDLYQGSFEAAVKELKVLRDGRKKLDDNERYLPSAESIYIHYLFDDPEGADKIYLQMKGDRKSVTSPTILSDYRTALLVLGFISNDKVEVEKVVQNFHLALAGKEDSARVRKEKELFGAVYQKLRAAKPELELPENW